MLPGTTPVELEAGLEELLLYDDSLDEVLTELDEIPAEVENELPVEVLELDTLEELSEELDSCSKAYRACMAPSERRASYIFTWSILPV